jgi:hypothetical protein
MATAEALASYAKMAGDSLRQSLIASKPRRMGELLKQFDTQGRRTDHELKNGAVQKLSQSEAAEP